jgi:hypothetical protein
MWKNVFLFCLLSAVFLPAFAAFCQANPNAAAPEPVARVAAGALSTANAAWWGFNAEDATDCLQSAIDSKAARVIVPYVGADWIVRPLKLRSDIEIDFEPGVVIMAKKDEFRGGGDSLFSAGDASNIVLRGYGATLRMRKKDYQNPPYSKAEWRTGLDLCGCSNVLVEGLTIESTGGDGIYIGCTSKQPYCENVVLRNVVCADNHRQGISVIGAKNMLIENCTLASTDGTLPKAGIDFEPNGPSESLVNCTVRNCLFADNAGAGILVYLNNLTRKSDPVSITFENCRVRGGQDTAIGIGALKDDGPEGHIQFVNCVCEGAAKGALYFYDKSIGSARVTFENCSWKDCGTGKGRAKYAPILLHARKKSVTSLGGINFINCHVYDCADRPVLNIENKTHAVVGDIKGTIFVHNSAEAAARKQKEVSIDLQLTQVR